MLKDTKTIGDISKLSAVTIALAAMIIGIAFNVNTALSQTDGPLEELQNQSFSQVVVSSTQIEELSASLNDAIQAANNGNMSDVLLQLKILGNQIDVIKEAASAFDN